MTDRGRKYKARCICGHWHTWTEGEKACGDWMPKSESAVAAVADVISEGLKEGWVTAEQSGLEAIRKKWSVPTSETTELQQFFKDVEWDKFFLEISAWHEKEMKEQWGMDMEARDTEEKEKDKEITRLKSELDNAVKLKEHFKQIADDKYPQEQRLLKEIENLKSELGKANDSLTEAALQATGLRTQMQLDQRRIKELQAPEWAEGFRREGRLAAVDEILSWLNEFDLDDDWEAIKDKVKQMKEKEGK